MTAQLADDIRSEDATLWSQTRLRGHLPTTLPLIERLPELQDAQRWRQLSLAGREWCFAQPITFTPYASAQPCSARCRFCSENLRPSAAGPAAATLRPPADYFAGLRRVLRALVGLPMSWSLSGLENSDDPAWLLQLLESLQSAEAAGCTIEQRVLYSNGHGLAGPAGDALIESLRRFGLSWLELSRHHHAELSNQALMRFRDGVAVRDNQTLHGLVARLQLAFPVKLVCVVQRGGIADASLLRAYLDWARALGVKAVIFRELARLDAGYRANATARYLAAARVPVANLFADCLDDASLGARLQPRLRTRGYYFSNVVCRFDDDVDVTFEAADYADMHARHASGRVYKLVYFANGELCGGWQPGRDVLWRAHATV